MNQKPATIAVNKAGGDPGVNVLQLNLALDVLAPKGALADKKP
jgi:hypothetical protein